MRTNPWRYLAAYKEPQLGDKESFSFCGREKESCELASLVKRNLFVTLYGRTGIGKTSLLEAGVFPLLRKDDYVPVVVRFGMQDFLDKSFAQIIVSSIENQGLEIRSTVDKVPEPTLDNGQPNIDYLWIYFATRHFYQGEHKKVFPVIVLDQFEENLISFRGKSEILLEQLYSLIDDNKNYPDGFHSETNFRFVLSIREDELYRLEEAVDKCQMLDFKNNRYRLTHLSEECAKEVICEPGSEILPIDKDEKQAVIAEILKQATEEDGDNINTLLLSLVCSCLYDRCAARKQSRFTYSDIRALSNNLLVDYYKSLHINKKTRRIIERKLIDKNGRRNVINVDDLDIPKSELEELCSGSKRILQKTNKRVELVHDLLAKTIFEIKKKRKENTHSHIFKICVLTLFSVILVLGLLRSVFTISGTDKYNSIPLFCQTDSIINSNDVVFISNEDNIELLTLTGNGFCHVLGCPNLKRIIVQANMRGINIDNCPSLRYLELPDSVNRISITRCPQLKTLYLPHVIEMLSFDDFLEKVVPKPGSSRYIIFGKSVWDVERACIIHSKEYIPSRRDSVSVVFPYQLCHKSMLTYKSAKFINKGKITDEGNLVSGNDSIYGFCDTLTSIDLSGKWIAEGAFDNTPNVATIILDAGTKFESSHAASFPKLHHVIIRQSPDLKLSQLENLLDVLAVTPQSLVYEIQGNGPLKKTAEGMILYGKEPVTISAESKKQIETYNINDSTTALCTKGWRAIYDCKTDSNKTKTSNSISIIGSSGHPKVALTSETFRMFNRLFSSDDLYFFMGDETKEFFDDDFRIVFCGKLTSKPRVFYLTSSCENLARFVGLQDSVKKEISLLVPYGHINQYIYNSKFDGFNDIRELPLMQTLGINTLNSFKGAIVYFKHHKGQFVLLIMVAIFTLTVLLLLNYKRFSQHESMRLVKFKALYTSLAIVGLGVFTWSSAYWFLWFWFFRSINANICASLIALINALIMAGLTYRNTWHFVWRKIVFKLKRNSKL